MKALWSAYSVCIICFNVYRCLGAVNLRNMILQGGLLLLTDRSDCLENENYDWACT